MNAGELEQYLKSLEKDMGRIESDVTTIKEKTIPGFQDKLVEFNSKIIVSTTLWGINLVLMTFLLYKVYEIAGKIH